MYRQSLGPPFRNLVLNLRSRGARRRKLKLAGQNRRSKLLLAECLEQRPDCFRQNQITYQPATSTILVEGTAGVDTVNVWTDTSKHRARYDGQRHPAVRGRRLLRAPNVAPSFDFGEATGNDLFSEYIECEFDIAFGEGGKRYLKSAVPAATRWIGGDGNDNIYGGRRQTTIWQAEPVVIGSMAPQETIHSYGGRWK